MAYRALRIFSDPAIFVAGVRVIAKNERDFPGISANFMQFSL